MPFLIFNAFFCINTLYLNYSILEVEQSDLSYLNKILNQKLNRLNEGIVEVSKQQNDPNSPLYSVLTFENLRMLV